MNDSEDLPFTVERWDMGRREVIARCQNAFVCTAAYRQACIEYPKGKLRAANGAHTFKQNFRD